MKAIVNDKKHITLVSHTNGVTIVEASGCIIDLDFQSLASICEIADLGNAYTLLNCGFPVNDIITSYEQYIVCNIN